jgi:hypothetical protein
MGSVTTMHGCICMLAHGRIRAWYHVSFDAEMMLHDAAAAVHDTPTIIGCSAGPCRLHRRTGSGCTCTVHRRALMTRVRSSVQSQPGPRYRADQATVPARSPLPKNGKARPRAREQKWRLCIWWPSVVAAQFRWAMAGSKVANCDTAVLRWCS